MFTLGYDPISDEIIQTKVKFETSNVIITAILSCDDNLINSVPVSAIRGRANTDYPYSININKDGLIQTINRLLLFATGGSSKELFKPYSEFKFESDKVVIYDIHKENSEIVYYNNTILNMEEPYITTLDLTDLKKTLEVCPEQYLTINFGDGSAIVLSRPNVKKCYPRDNDNVIMANYGKKFETKFKEDWEQFVPNSLLVRLYDTTNGYMGIKNLSDYIGYKKPNMFIMELKSLQGNTFSLKKINSI